MTMTRNVMARRLFMVFAIVLLSSCGGDSDSTTSTSTPTESTSAVTGVITGFGSVFINGVEYETSSASISTDDDAGATESDLEVGMIVSIAGEINSDGVTGSATAIFYEEQLKGPLSGTVDTTNQTLTVLGQNVTYDDLTSLGTLDLTTLTDGNLLEISGYTQSDGSIYATRIKLESGGANVTYKIQGNVSGVNTGANTFSLGTLTINYASAELKKLTESDLVNGLPVRVKGDATNYNAGLSTFTVNEVKSKQEDYDDGSKGSIEGYITRFASSSDFDVNSVSVVTNSSTEFDDGAASDLALDIQVKVKGTFDDNGNLVATKVKIVQQSKVGLEATVSAVDVSASTITVLGVGFTVTSQTKIEDDSDAEVRFFDLTDINVGDYVKIKGYESASNTYVANLLERKDLDTEYEVKGEVTAVTGSSFDVLGLTVTVDGSTSYSDGLSSLGDITVGMIVEAETNTSLLADSVQRDD
ncbi:DUF5666 domain-containing protein [Enterovibrio sp. 27052020O]|uniref:DUF5666 domain-containing protein n=1 Tax=Enterovibrio sp. 27052020O TaxID=3241166 RepID=UPI003890D5D9